MHSPLGQCKLAMSHNTVYNVSTELTWPCWTPGNVHGTASTLQVHTQCMHSGLHTRRMDVRYAPYLLPAVGSLTTPPLCKSSLTLTHLFVYDILITYHESPSHFCVFPIHVGLKLHGCWSCVSRCGFPLQVHLIWYYLTTKTLYLGWRITTFRPTHPPSIIHHWMHV